MRLQFELGPAGGSSAYLTWGSLWLQFFGGSKKKKKILIPSGLKQPLYGFTRLSGGESRLLAGATSALHVTSSEV